MLFTCTKIPNFSSVVKQYDNNAGRSMLHNVSKVWLAFLGLAIAVLVVGMVIAVNARENRILRTRNFLTRC